MAAKRSRPPGWLRAVNDGDGAALARLCAADLALHAHDPLLPALPPGAAGLVRWVETLRTAFPDLTLTLEAESGQGRTHVFTFRARGTHRGRLANLRPTGRPAAFVGRLMLRHDQAERIAEVWLRTNLASLMPQLGMGPELSPPAPTTAARPKRAAHARAER